MFGQDLKVRRSGPTSSLDIQGQKAPERHGAGVRRPSASRLEPPIKTVRNEVQAFLMDGNPEAAAVRAWDDGRHGSVAGHRHQPCSDPNATHEAGSGLASKGCARTVVQVLVPENDLRPCFATHGL